MDLKEYFQRIGFNGPSDKADFDTLCEIHKLHIMTIPFESLSVQCAEWITADLEIIYNKIVRSRRGGVCTENNLLFSWVLREMGYTFTTLSARCFNSLGNYYNPVYRHFINKVDLDGKSYIADVSYGGSDQIWNPVEMISGKDQPQAPGTFRLQDDGGKWVLRKTGRKVVVKNEELTDSSPVIQPQTKNIYCFFLMPQNTTEPYLKTNRWLQTNPDSPHINKSICSLQTPTGYRTLVGWTYGEVTFNYEEGTDLREKRIISNEEIATVLEEKFNIVLTKKFIPINNNCDFPLD